MQARGDGSGIHTIAHGLRQLAITTAEESAALAQAQMCRHEIAPRYAIAVGENQIIAARGENAEVERAAFAEAPVFLPHVLQREWQRRQTLLQQRAGLVARAVVDHDELEIAMVLMRKAGQAQVQPRGLVVSADDDAGDRRGHVEMIARGWRVAGCSGMLAEMTGISPSPQNQPIRIFCGADRSQQLAFRVLADSIRRHTQREVEIRAIDNADVPLVADPRHAPYTEFSFARFAIPALAGHQGRAIYLDSDMLVFRDIAELWDAPLDGAHVAIEIGSRSDPAQTAHARNRHAAVMLLDCARLDWDVARIVAGLGRDYDYNALMTLDPLLAPEQLREAIARGWNDLDRYDAERTRLLHFTEIRTQPWVASNHPHGGLWVDAVRRMLAEGALANADIHAEIAAGYVRPSLALELGLRDAAGIDARSPDSLAAYDRTQDFVAHRALLARFAQRKRASARAERDAAMHRQPTLAWWHRLRYRIRHGAEQG